LNHSLFLNAAGRVAPRWKLGFSASGNVSNHEGFLFSPTVFSNAASASANFTDLSAAVLGQGSTNTQVGTILQSAALVESPARTLLYGERMFTSAARTFLSYAYSPRFSVTFAGGAARSQHIGTSQNGSTQGRYLTPRTTSVNASLGTSYSISPRTQFGATVATSRIVSSLYDSYSTVSTASLGRTLGRGWFLQFHGGVGFTNPVRQTVVRSTAPRPVGGASLGFRTFSNTFLGSFDRTTSDSYGLGARTTSTSSASWRWNRPGNAWWLDGSFGWQQLQGGASQEISSWRGTASWGRALGLHVAVLMQYVYLNYSGRVGNSPYNSDQNAVRVAVVWTPQPAPQR
jgi:hypothetical protein